ncbi:hypothetical protein [Candidatus Odyssella thessalonicensis]|uniref:hypothetical protein n=1 Tax=Candidatus Odyssella thessalonicensis TaxID=84647 RepID=UPI000225ACC0|nr:hypothetical protein [Candidatus Odyssella thessalonicensis]
MANQSYNSWLHQKRRDLIGSDDFTPKNYGHLLWYWGVIDDKFRLFLKKYGRLRGLVLASQGRVVVWTNNRHLYPGKGSSISEKDAVKLEQQWRQLIERWDVKTIAFLDWLTQEPIDYNATKQEIVKRFHSYSRKKLPSGRQ